MKALLISAVLLVTIGAGLNIQKQIIPSDSPVLASIETIETSDLTNWIHAPNTRALLGVIYERSPDIVLMDSFNYIYNYKTLHQYRAIGMIPSSYGLHGPLPEATETPQIGYISELPALYFIETNQLWKNFSPMMARDSRELALNLDYGHLENTVDYAPDTLHFNSESTLFATLILVNQEWYTQEHKQSLDALLSDLSAIRPDESAMVEVVRWLYSNALIDSRYYFKDLVMDKVYD
ncbi:hypothetical protein [Fusibacter tunisiensis]|uniref:Uncharacterized protein n=1 Tax=Fusibacter tunisiensis TaxID=1008308 RepID=A0ABS2MMA4_9FIRM|nr:hypothetical protein [Fusibacter tunisiensis]MBM7560528.1 hypothetical protein [Fusibacter tunisiensis]